MVLNIDTGERIPLSRVEEILPKRINPLSLHLMKLTNEYQEEAIYYFSRLESYRMALVGLRCSIRLVWFNKPE